MISPALLNRLQAAQQRAAHEQQLLSGREWILVAALVQGMVSLHPLYSWINQALLGDSPRPGLPPAIRFGAALILAGALLALWRWARHAPFRAALAAVVVFVAIEGTLGFLDPHQLVSSAVVKAIVLLGLMHATLMGYQRRRAL